MRSSGTLGDATASCPSETFSTSWGVMLHNFPNRPTMNAHNSGWNICWPNDHSYLPTPLLLAFIGHQFSSAWAFGASFFRARTTDWVVLGNYFPKTPTDPSVQTLPHSVPQNSGCYVLTFSGFRLKTLWMIFGIGKGYCLASLANASQIRLRSRLRRVSHFRHTCFTN